MKNKTNNQKLTKNYLPSIVVTKEDKTHIETDIDTQGNMQEIPTIQDDLDKEIEPGPPRTPTL